MKYGYKCQCGWQLDRANLTRHEYSAKKAEHAKTCDAAKKELEQSRKAQPAK